ncbi:MAG: hypothetical protein WEB60_05200 [Terrimicrobiaceae bacterium]
MAREPRKSSRLAAEEKLIEKQHEDLLRKQKELEARLIKLPAVIEKQKVMIEEQARQRAKKAAPPISPGRSRARKTTKRNRGTPGRQAQVARIKAIALLAIFAVIIFLVLRAIPAG